MNVESSGQWNEERLWVLRTLEEIKAEQRRQAREAAADRASLLERASLDIRRAHDKIRALESADRTLRLKNWIMTVVLSCSGAVVFEVVKAWLHGWKP